MQHGKEILNFSKQIQAYSYQFIKFSFNFSLLFLRCRSVTFFFTITYFSHQHNHAPERTYLISKKLPSFTLTFSVTAPVHVDWWISIRYYLLTFFPFIFYSPVCRTYYKTRLFLISNSHARNLICFSLQSLPGNVFPDREF